MKLKKITPKDFSELRKMINTARWKEKVFLTPDKKLTSTDVASFIQNKQGKNYWNYIIWEKNKRAGYIDFEILNENKGHISGIYIKPEFRKKGYAKKALNFVLKKLKKERCQSVYANIFPDNEAAKKFFKNRGFTEEKIFKHLATKSLALRLVLKLD